MNTRPVRKRTRCGVISEILGSSRFYFSIFWGAIFFALFRQRCHGFITTKSVTSVGVKLFLNLSNIEPNGRRTFCYFYIRITSNLLFTKYAFDFMVDFPTGIYLFKVNNRNTRTKCEICSTSLRPGSGLDGLTLFFPMFPVFWCFQGDQKGTLGRKALKNLSWLTLMKEQVIILNDQQISCRHFRPAIFGTFFCPVRTSFVIDAKTGHKIKGEETFSQKKENYTFVFFTWFEFLCCWKTKKTFDRIKLLSLDISTNFQLPN